ncbi:ion transport protein [Ditylenchus destructor]|nr:ion transport protein [Ditylenchus destructor]
MDAKLSSKKKSLLRDLRPLRANNRAKGLKVQCVIVAVRSIGNIMLLTSMLTFMFAIIGLQLFKATFFSCNDLSKMTEAECRGEFITYEDGDPNKPLMMNRTWSPFNFENVLDAIISLSAVSPFEDWPDLLNVAIKSNEEDKRPVYNARHPIAIFFICFIVFIAFFMMNIFVAFVILTFRNVRECEDENCELDKNQRKCIEFALKAEPYMNYIPRNRLQYGVWWFVTDEFFGHANFIIILLSTTNLAMQHYPQDPYMDNILDISNLIFNAVFAFEALFKIIAWNPRNYFYNRCNSLDFVIVLGSFIDIIYGKLSLGSNIISINFFRLFCVMRLVKLLSREDGIKRMVWILMKPFCALSYGTLLIGLLFYNFHTLPVAVLLLIRSATGEAWQEIMLSWSGRDGVKCDAANFAYSYFISFFMLCSFLVINNFISIVIDNLDNVTRDSSILGPFHLEEFLRLWSLYDPDAKGRIKHLDVVNLLRMASPPLGFGKLCPHRLAYRRLVAMNMIMNSDGTGDIDEANEQLRDVIRRIWKRTPLRMLDEVVPPERMTVTVGKYYATLLIQDGFQRFKRRKEFEYKHPKFFPQG